MRASAFLIWKQTLMHPPAIILLSLISRQAQLSAKNSTLRLPTLVTASVYCRLFPSSLIPLNISVQSHSLSILSSSCSSTAPPHYPSEYNIIRAEKRYYCLLETLIDPRPSDQRLLILCSPLHGIRNI